MRDFTEAYKQARAKAREYTGAKRAGWADPGKRTRDNHAILVPRREAVAMADELATTMYAKEVYLTWVSDLQGFFCVGKRVANSDFSKMGVEMT